MASTNKKATNGDLLKSGIFLIARLLANPRSKKFAPRMKGPQDQLAKAVRTKNEAENATIIAEANTEEVVFNIGELLSEMQLDLTADVKRQYDSPIYREFFPEGLTETRELDAEDLATEVDRILEHAFGKLPANSRTRNHEKKLKELRAELKGPVAALKEARSSDKEAENELIAAREAWFDAYDAVQGLLRAEFPRRKVFVDSFFRRQARKGKKKAGETTEKTNPPK